MKKLTLTAAAIVLASSLSLQAQDGKKQEKPTPATTAEKKAAKKQTAPEDKTIKKQHTEKKQKKEVDKSQN